MKRIIFIVSMIMSSAAYAATDVTEHAGTAVVGLVSVSSSATTAMSSNTVTNVFAYNICNEDSTNKLRCGYSTSVSTVATSQYLGFPVRPQECEYRAVSNKIVIYCQAEGTAAISATREVFGKPF